MPRTGVYRAPLVRALTLAAAILVMPDVARAQAVITVNDSISLRFGALLQNWVDFSQVSGPAGDANDGYQQNIFIRRMRLLFGGQIGRNVSFFVETDVPNLGKATGGQKVPTDVFLQDAYIEWKFAPTHMVNIGQILMPLCRNCLQSAASLLPIDYGAYSFAQSAATQSFVGRDVGVMLKGYLVGNRVEYRTGVFSGARQAANAVTGDPGARNSLRSAGRLMVNFLEPEVGNFYTGTYLGKRRVANLGASYDLQGEYLAYAVDGFLDHPLGTGAALTAQVDAVLLDGKTRFPALQKQSNLLAEAGIYFPATRLMPFVQFVSKDLKDVPNLDENRLQVGLGWFAMGHNATIKAGWTRIAPDVGAEANAFTVQFQAFYY